MKRSYSRKNLRLNSRRSKRYIKSSNPTHVKKNRAQKKTKEEKQEEIFRRIADNQENILYTIKKREDREYYRQLMAAKTEHERIRIINEKHAKRAG
jgi:hypothetical protein